MLLLTPGPDGGLRAVPTTALFGVGLIGAALAGCLREIGLTAEQHPFDWQDPTQHEVQLAAIGRRIRALRSASAGGPLVFVWAAGQAGFGADSVQTASELASFNEVLELAGELARDEPEGGTLFCMLSSVGGLFEGQRRIDYHSVPRPLRPYGELKLRQEELLRTTPARLRARIYRLTSVYGYGHGGARRGLVSTLLANSVRQQVTSLVGRLSTLRDFVWCADIARYIAAQLRGPFAAGEEVETLASAKPSSIHEVIRVVEGVTARRVYLRFLPNLTNDLDITVSRGLLPPGWSATDLRTAIVSLQHGAQPGVQRH